MSFLKLPHAEINLHYRLLENPSVSKESAVVVFLHGMIMDNLSSWFFTVANPVATAYDALVYDMRGHGFSDRPKTGYDVKDHCEDLKALTEAVIPGRRLILVGNSYGGLLSLNFAKQYPELVEGLVLVDAQVNNPEWQAQMLGSFTLQGEERDQVVIDNFQNWLGRSSKRRSSKLAQNAESLLEHTSLLDDIRQATLLSDEDLRGISAKTFAIYGAESDIVKTARKLETELEHCVLTVVPNATHSVLWEHTEMVKDWIIASVHALQGNYAVSLLADVKGSESEVMP